MGVIALTATGIDDSCLCLALLLAVASQFLTCYCVNSQRTGVVINLFFMFILLWCACAASHFAFCLQVKCFLANSCLTNGGSAVENFHVLSTIGLDLP